MKKFFGATILIGGSYLIYHLIFKKNKKNEEKEIPKEEIIIENKEYQKSKPSNQEKNEDFVK
jgi:hypothetical protein